MSLADIVENEIKGAVGPVLATGIMAGSLRYMGIERDQLTKENLEDLVKALKASLPMFVGAAAADGLIQKIKVRGEGVMGWGL